MLWVEGGRAHPPSGGGEEGGLLRRGREFEAGVEVRAALDGHALAGEVGGRGKGEELGGTEDSELRVADGTVYERYEVSCLETLRARGHRSETVHVRM